MTLRPRPTDKQNAQRLMRKVIGELKLLRTGDGGLRFITPGTESCTEAVARMAGVALGEVIERLKFCMDNPDAGLTFIDDDPVLIDKRGEWDYETLFRIGRTNVPSVSEVE